jgi:hypothetical protein
LSVFGAGYLSVDVGTGRDGVAVMADLVEEARGLVDYASGHTAYGVTDEIAIMRTVGRNRRIERGGVSLRPDQCARSIGVRVVCEYLVAHGREDDNILRARHSRVVRNVKGMRVRKIVDRVRSELSEASTGHGCWR